MGATSRIQISLEAWWKAGRRSIGQIEIGGIAEGFELRHLDDTEATNLKEFTDPADALDIARYNEAGDYRPLKTAPDLRRGWCLRLANWEEVVLALDYFYPAMLGSLRAAADGELPTTSLRETLKRQTGMYAMTKKVSVEDAEAVIAMRCADEGGCLKKILWLVEDEAPRISPPHNLQLQHEGPLPMPCAEGCNLLVAAIRQHLKKKSA